MNPFERIYTKGKLNYSYTVSEILGADGLCFNAGRKMLEFGNDVFTSCLVKLSLQDLSNCSNIRCVVSPQRHSFSTGKRNNNYSVHAFTNHLFFLSWTSLTIKYPRVCCWCIQYNSELLFQSYPREQLKKLQTRIWPERSHSKLKNRPKN